MSNETLRECPFCGYAAKLDVTDCSDIHLGDWYAVSCTNPNCGASLGNFEDEEKALARWNARIDKAEFRKGDLVHSIEELLKCENIYHRDQLLHRSWFMGWQLRYATMEISKNAIRRAVRDDG